MAGRRGLSEGFPTFAFAAQAQSLAPPPVPLMDYPYKGFAVVMTLRVGRGWLMGVERPRRYYSKEKCRLMFIKIEATKVANRRAALAAAISRQTCELEKAKIALQRRGYIVFAQSLHIPFSKLIVVGSKLMTVDEVIAHAARFGSSNPQGDR